MREAVCLSPATLSALARSFLAVTNSASGRVKRRSTPCSSTAWRKLTRSTERWNRVGADELGVTDLEFAGFYAVGVVRIAEPASVPALLVIAWVVTATAHRSAEGQSQEQPRHGGGIRDETQFGRNRELAVPRGLARLVQKRSRG